MLEESGAFADEGDGDDIDDWDMPDGMLEAMELQEFVEGAGYQNSCDEKGVFTVGDEKMIAFATELANAGNEEAQLVLARYFLANESTEAQKAQAIAWVTEMAENGDVAAQMILEDLD
jgi:TPR repeat protein